VPKTKMFQKKAAKQMLVASSPKEVEPPQATQTQLEG